jgi:DNA-binding winged helix-turn-helix (wHTH) protein
VFELDAPAGELRRDGRRLKIQPQPFTLLRLLVSQPGRLVTREEIRRELWPDGTFVDFDQAVNFAVRQVRDALGDSADSPLYIETIPKRGYKFIAPVKAANADLSSAGFHRPTTVRLQKALWANIAEMRAAEAKQRRFVIGGFLFLGGLVVVLALLLFLRSHA